MQGPDDYAAADKAHIWHPFTPMRRWLDSDPVVIERADGFHLIDTRGRRYIDGVGSLWVNVHGHRVPGIDDAIRAQLGRVAHSTFLGLSNTPAIELAEMLVRSAPPGLTRIFYSESGASAVEVALKMAFQYWQRAGQPSKKRFVAFENAYHGDTIGAMSVGGIEQFHAIFAPLLFDVERALSPYCYRCPIGLTYPDCRIKCLDSLESILAEGADEIAAVVIEPSVQAAGGIITSPPGHLRRVRELCDAHDVLLIADEVAVGAGRTGFLWACTRDGIAPDLMAAGKGLTGGYLPLSVTFASEKIFDAFLGDGEAFFHGHSYSGNPLACAAAVANLELMEKDNFLGEVRRKASNLTDALQPLASRQHVGDIRQRGLMAGIELVATKSTKEPYDPALRIGAAVCEKAREHGVIIRPLGDVVVLCPPLAIPDELLAELVAAVAKSIDEVCA